MKRKTEVSITVLSYLVQLIVSNFLLGYNSQAFPKPKII